MSGLDALGPLSALERDYAERLHVLFLRVDPQKPEKGVCALLLRARRLAAESGFSPEESLERIYQGAVERTEARLRLLGACALKPPGEGGESSL